MKGKNETIILLNKCIESSVPFHTDPRNPIFAMKVDENGKKIISLLKKEGITVRFADVDEVVTL